MPDFGNPYGVPTIPLGSVQQLENMSLRPPFYPSVGYGSMEWAPLDYMGERAYSDTMNLRPPIQTMVPSRPMGPPEDTIRALGLLEAQRFNMGPHPLLTAMPDVHLGPGVLMKQLAGGAGQRMLHSIIHNGSPIGELNITNAGKNGIINWVGEELNRTNAMQGLNQLVSKIGPTGLSNLASQLKSYYPEMERLIGERISGAPGNIAGMAEGQGGRMVSVDLDRLVNRALQHSAAQNRLTLAQTIAKNRATAAVAPDAEQQFGLNVMRRFYK